MIQNNNPSCQQPHSLRLAPAGSSRNMQESSNNGCSPEIDFAENMSGKPGIQRKKTLVPVCVHLNQSIECCSKLKPETMNLFAGHVQHVCHGFLVTRMKEKWDILLQADCMIVCIFQCISIFIFICLNLNSSKYLYFYVCCPSQSH